MNKKIQVKFIKDTEKFKVGEIAYAKESDVLAYKEKKLVEIMEPKKEIVKEKKVKEIKKTTKPEKEKKIKTDEPIAKQILDRWATAIVPKEAIYSTKGNAGVNQDKCLHYEKCKFRGDLVLWIAPKNCIRIEFEDTPTHNHRYIVELESAAKSLGYDYCITGHGGKSDYFNMFNIKGIPLTDDNKTAKMLLIDMLITSRAKDQLDRTNLGWTLSPIINMPHWKPKYNGAIHKILRGKNPLEHENKFPVKLLKKLEKAKNRFDNNKKKWIGSNEWVKDFLINFCTENELPKGARHAVIEKNLAALIIFDKDKETIKQRYYKKQGRTHDSLRTWERAIVNGEYTEVSGGELAKFIKEYNLDYIIPKPKIKKEFKEDTIYETILNLYSFNKEEIAENFYKIKPYFFDGIGFFWIWNDVRKCYERKDEFQMMNRLKQCAETKKFQVTQSTFWTEMLRSLKLIGRNYEPKPFRKTWVQFKDEIFDYVSKQKFKSTPTFFNTNPIPWKIGETEDTPIIDKLFEEWVGKDYIKTLKETIALGMMQDYPLHRIICLLGRGLNGKGVFQRLLKNVMGEKNVCSSNLTKLIRNTFETSKLYKKLICLMGETDFATLKDTSILKQLSGQDLISAEFKGKDGFDFENFSTLFVATNSLPITEDRTDGFYRRWLIIDFPNQFEEGKDILTTVPEEEYSNLCKQLLDLMPALVERGIFDNDGTIEERKKKYEDKSNPVKLFIRKNYVDDVNGQIPFFEFYDKFNIFCSERGFRELSKKNVSQVLDDMGYHTEKKDIKIGEEWKKWVFIIGIDILRTVRTDSTLNHIHSSIRVNEYKTGFERYERFENAKEEVVKDIIHAKCKVCGSTPSHIFNKQGQPLCETCFKAENAQKQH